MSKGQMVKLGKGNCILRQIGHMGLLGKIGPDSQISQKFLNIQMLVSWAR